MVTKMKSLLYGIMIIAAVVGVFEMIVAFKPLQYALMILTIGSWVYLVGDVLRAALEEDI